MFRSLVCGSNFAGECEERDGEGYSSKSSPSSTPRRQRRHVFCRRRKDGRNVGNPYSNYGLDKFSSLVADLDERREKISSEHREVKLVRFVYSSSDDLVPVVIKEKQRSDREETEQGDCVVDKHVILNHSTKRSEESCGKTEKVKEVKIKPNMRRKRRVRFDLEGPSFNMAAVVILILIILGFAGRAVAILCSSAAWYVVPALSRSGSKPRYTTGIYDRDR